MADVVEVQRAEHGRRRVVEEQVEIESNISKQFITLQFQALKAGAFNRVARGKITEYYTRASSQRRKAKDVLITSILFRLCKNGFLPAPLYRVRVVELAQRAVQPHVRVVEHTRLALTAQVENESKV